MTLQQLGGKEAPHPCFFFSALGANVTIFFLSIYVLLVDKMTLRV